MREMTGGFSVLCDENLYTLHLDPGKELSWMFNVVNAQVSLEYTFKGKLLVTRKFFYAFF